MERMDAGTVESVSRVRTDNGAELALEHFPTFSLFVSI